MKINMISLFLHDVGDGLTDASVRVVAFNTSYSQPCAMEQAASGDIAVICPDLQVVRFQLTRFEELQFCEITMSFHENTGKSPL